MNQRHIIFIPGKNPKPPSDQHQSLLWRTLLEGVKRAEPELVNEISQHAEDFKLISWNYLYYHLNKDISADLSWIDALINQHGASKEDIKEAKSTHRQFDRLLYRIIDYAPFLMDIMPQVLKQTAEDIRRYFHNENNIACDIRDLLKNELRPLLEKSEKITVIGHSMGSIIAYDTLWELSHLEKLPGKVDLFLTLGSPLGMNYVQRRLAGHKYQGKKKYPLNIRSWENVSSVGDITALDRIFADDFAEMKELGLIEDIVDHCDGIYNFFRNQEGLNCHRSYGYLVNPAVGKVIADWWKSVDG